MSVLDQASRPLHDVPTPLPALTLTLKVEGAPAVHLTYDPECPIEQTAVTMLDQGTDGPAWNFGKVVATGLVFLLLYVRDHNKWPAELRSTDAGEQRP